MCTRVQIGHWILFSVIKYDFKFLFLDECKMKPKALHPGEVVFFVIQPRFMNVDIRIIIDVTQGKLNVFMSTNDDTYIAFPNSTTGVTDINVDGQYGHWENGTLNSKASRNIYLEREALGLRTYITITQPKTILLVKNLEDRLVITLPEVRYNYYWTYSISNHSGHSGNFLID